MDLQKTLVINTGGTINAEAYGEVSPDVAVMKMPSLVPGVVKNCGAGVEYFPWEKITDSKYFDRQDYLKLAEFITLSEMTRFVVLHGTDKMVELAKFLKEIVPPQKTVMLTGAFLPLDNGAASDGVANIEYAVKQAVIQSYSRCGVWIAFHGQLFDPEYTVKNFEAKRFERSNSLV